MVQVPAAPGSPIAASSLPRYNWSIMRPVKPMMSYLSGVPGHGRTWPSLPNWPSQSLTGKYLSVPIWSWSVDQSALECPVSLQT